MPVDVGTPRQAVGETHECLDALHGLTAQADAARRFVWFDRNEEIYSGIEEPGGTAEGGDELEYWYCVISGAARKYVLLADGRRRIVDFLLPGDYFGFRARHKEFFAADAIVGGTLVARYSRKALETAADRDPQLGRRIREIAFASISRSQARLLILGRITALKKVHAFLEELAERSSARNRNTVVLPMSRYDIADYLALSVETVSRSLTELRRRGAIRCTSTRRIHILASEQAVAAAM
jgi:CRP-like cAMP-binding protein